MAERNPRKPHRAVVWGTTKLELWSASFLLLALLSATAILAQWDEPKVIVESGGGQQPSGIQGGNPLPAPSKEYYYAGGRLIATEEPCPLAISPLSKFFLLSGGAGSVSLTTAAACNWTAIASDSWITFVSATSGSGSETINYEVRENFTGAPRQATVTAGGQTQLIIQDSSASQTCTYEVTPANAAFNNTGGSGGIQVTCAGTCAWQALSNKSWITVTSIQCGIGNGTVTYAVAANPTGAARVGVITIAGRSFHIKQQA